MEKLVTQLSSPGSNAGPVRDRGGTRIMEPSTRSASTEHEQRMELKLRRELGEQILALLDDPRTEDILLNPDSSLWTKRLGEGFTRVGEMSPTQAVSALSTIAAWRGTILNHQNPILETELPIDGSRFEGIVSPVVRKPVFAIRLRPRKIFTLTDYETSGILTTKDDPVNRLRRRHDFASSIHGLQTRGDHPRRRRREKEHPGCGLNRQRQNHIRERMPRCAGHLDAARPRDLD